MNMLASLRNMVSPKPEETASKFDKEFSHAKPVQASWDVDGVAGQFLNFSASQVLKDYNSRGWDFVRADGGELYFSRDLPRTESLVE